MTKGSMMVDPVTLWPVRSVSKSIADEGTRTTSTQAASIPTRTAATGLPKLVNLTAELSKAGPPMDNAKIAQLRQAIARGEYSHDVDAIAHSMIGFFRTGE
jgi:flagellar biosynthesis anti-sigma factor FlgM